MLLIIDYCMLLSLDHRVLLIIDHNVLLIIDLRVMLTTEHHAIVVIHISCVTNIEPPCHLWSATARESRGSGVFVRAMLHIVRPVC